MLGWIIRKDIEQLEYVGPDYESPASELLIDITPNMSLYTIQRVTSIDGRNRLTSSPAYYLHSAIALVSNSTVA